jgi:hypothetical protein
MKCYSITESEIQQIGLANIGSTAAVAIGSALFAFGADIFKSAVLGDPIPRQVEALAQSIQWLTLGGGVFFYAVAIVIWLWRRTLLRTIRQESGEPPEGVAPMARAARPELAGPLAPEGQS